MGHSQSGTSNSREIKAVDLRPGDTVTMGRNPHLVTGALRQMGNGLVEVPLSDTQTGRRSTLMCGASDRITRCSTNSRCPVCSDVPMVGHPCPACGQPSGWRERYERLYDAVEEFLLWEPGRRGFAAARRALVGVLRGEEGER